MLLALTGCALQTTATSEAPAAAPAYISALQEHLAAATRVYLHVPYFGDPSASNHSYLSARLDLPTRRAAIQTGDRTNFVYLDGVLTSSNSTGGIGNLGTRHPDLEPIFAALLAELDAGLANTTFTPAWPPSYSRRTGNPAGSEGGWFLVDFPGSWDAGWRIFVEVGGDPTFARAVGEIEVYEGDSQTPAVWSAMVAQFNLYDNVQWEPDWTQSNYGAPEPWSTRTYYWPGFKRDEYGGLYVDYDDKEY